VRLTVALPVLAFLAKEMAAVRLELGVMLFLAAAGVVLEVLV
jgi:hypothetical protein